MENEYLDSTETATLDFVSGKIEPNYENLLSFHDSNAEIGKLGIRDGRLFFEGHAEKSAQTLFEFLKSMIDAYIKDK